MSETSAISTMNTPDEMRLGTRRPADPGRRAAARRRRRAVRQGPERDEGLPRPAGEDRRVPVAADGWLATGDIAEIDADGFVRIVDRKKELIINAAGKNMSPANIEARIKAASPLIGQAVCIGDARPVQRRADRARPRRRRRPRPGEPGDARARSSRRSSWPTASSAASSRSRIHDPPGRVAARRRRADPDDEAQAQADRREVRGRDRGALRLSPGVPAAASSPLWTPRGADRRIADLVRRPVRGRSFRAVMRRAAGARSERWPWGDGRLLALAALPAAPGPLWPPTDTGHGAMDGPGRSARARTRSARGRRVALGGRATQHASTDEQRATARRVAPLAAGPGAGPTDAAAPRSPTSDPTDSARSTSGPRSGRSAASHAPRRAASGSGSASQAATGARERRCSASTRPRRSRRGRWPGACAALRARAPSRSRSAAAAPRHGCGWWTAARGALQRGAPRRLRQRRAGSPRDAARACAGGWRWRAALGGALPPGSYRSSSASSTRAGARSPFARRLTAAERRTRARARLAGATIARRAPRGLP